MEWVKSKNYLQYPSNIPKHTASDPYWMKNDLLFNIPFCMHNNLNIITKIFRIIYLSLAVIFPYIPMHWRHESWVHKTRKIVHDTEKRVHFQWPFLDYNDTFKENIYLYKVLFVCFKGIILTDWSIKRKLNPRKYHICSPKICFFLNAISPLITHSFKTCPVVRVVLSNTISIY